MKNLSRYLFIQHYWLMGLLLASLAGCGSGSDQETLTAQANEQTEVAAETVATDAADAAAKKLDAHPGKALHDANCISCHDATVYTRTERKVSDFPKLVAQVKRCDANLGSRLFDDELQQVADYLNQAYYKYEE